jgi:hypothetical protein
MSPAKPAGQQPQGSSDALPNGQLPNSQLPERAAELASELSEAESESLRKRLARQIPELASRSTQVTRRGLTSSRDAAVYGLQSGAGAAGRRVRPATSAAVRGARAGGSTTLRGLRTTGAWLSSQVLEMAPKVPIRNLATLQQQHPGLGTEELADSLVTGAARASAGVGAAVGATAAVPFIPTAPVELVVETMVLVGIELKLIAELHEVYGMPAPGSPSQRMLAYVGSWADRRGVRITASGLALAVGSPLRRKLERRLLVKASKSTLALAPLLTGAAAAALINHRETSKLGRLVRDDLRRQALEAR